MRPFDQFAKRIEFAKQQFAHESPFENHGFGLDHLVSEQEVLPHRFQPIIPAAVYRLYDTQGVDLYAAGRRYVRLGDGEWLAPINFLVAKIVKIEGQPVSIVGGVRYWMETFRQRSAWLRRSARNDIPISDALIERSGNADEHDAFDVRFTRSRKLTKQFEMSALGQKLTKKIARLFWACHITR